MLSDRDITELDLVVQRDYRYGSEIPGIATPERTIVLGGAYGSNANKRDVRNGTNVAFKRYPGQPTITTDPRFKPIGDEWANALRRHPIVRHCF